MQHTKLDTVCIIKLGIIDPSDNFSLIYPIAKAIHPVAKIIKRDFNTPTMGKNITPWISPNNIDCIRFPLLNPIL